jgi:BirA family biotin operon repressor/biotin-[acetyl-CoA-carboxylase] ligase
MIFDIHRYDTLPSTQQQLRSMPAREGCVVCALYQTHGRGQRNTSWESRHGENMLFSLYLEPCALPAGNLFDVSRCIALAAACFLMDKGIDATIKWANDILAENQKIAGILIEPCLCDGVVRSIICGIGLNVNQRSFGIERAVSMSLLTGCMYDIDACMQQLLQKIDFYYTLLQNQQYPALRQVYNSMLYRKSGMHKYCANGEIFSAVMVLVSDEGNLILQDESGMLRQYRFKEVQFVFE